MQTLRQNGHPTLQPIGQREGDASHSEVPVQRTLATADSAASAANSEQAPSVMPQGEPYRMGKRAINHRDSPNALNSDKVGFVAVVAVVLNKETDLNTLIAHYREEAFSGVPDRAALGGLVIGLNMQVGGNKEWSDEQYMEVISAISHGNDDFPVTIVPYSWYWGGKTGENGRLSVPYGMIREFIVNHEETQVIAEGLRSTGISDVYIHLGDADAHSLHIGPADRGGTSTQRPGLFTEAAEALHAESYPDILSGGYRAPENASLMEKLSVDVDMQTRLALARRSVLSRGSDSSGGRPMQDPSALGYGPYLPEPNTFVRHDPQRDLLFGTDIDETVRMIEGLQDPRIVFDIRLAVATDMDRLGEKFQMESVAGSVRDSLAELREIFLRGWSAEQGGGDTKSGDVRQDPVISEDVLTLFNDPQAQGPIDVLRNALRQVRQTHVAPATIRPQGSNFERSLERVKVRGGESERAEAERHAKVASAVSLDQGVTVLLREAISAWRADRDFDPLQPS
ncbi:hypothetical protein ACFXPT_37535 [Streptomyces goshikiensis]|uniref:hypothetical protein n=1 Tax=Streptomyces goshikiensis TaxID=1942 RepID=UPI0036BF2852